MIRVGCVLRSRSKAGRLIRFGDGVSAKAEKSTITGNLFL